MNQKRSLLYLAAILGVLGLVLGSNIGAFMDQTTALTIDRGRLDAARACWYCPAAAGPFLLDVAKVNGGLLAGAVSGLGAGLLVAWAIWHNGGKPQPARKLPAQRQASELARLAREFQELNEPSKIILRLHDELLQLTGAECGTTFSLESDSTVARAVYRVGDADAEGNLWPVEQGVVASAHGRIVDYTAEDVSMEKPAHPGIGAALLVPLVFERTVVGLVHLHHGRLGAFDGAMMRFVETVTDHAAVALHNARRYAEQVHRVDLLSRRTNQLRMLTDVAQVTRADRALVANLESIASAVREATEASVVLVGLVPPGDPQLEYVAAAGLPADSPWQWQLMQVRVHVETARRWMREEIRHDGTYLIPAENMVEVAQSLGIQQIVTTDAPESKSPPQGALALTPLLDAAGNVAGVFCLYSTRGWREPLSPQLQIAESFAGQAMAVVDNARMLFGAREHANETQNRVTQLEVFSEATAVATASLRLEEIPAEALEQLRRIVPYDGATFWRRDPATDRLVVAASRKLLSDPQRETAESAEARDSGRAINPLFSEIIAAHSVILVPDLKQDPRFPIPGMVYVGRAMRSWLAVPLVVQGQVIAILALEKAEADFYDSNFSTLALAFANRVAVACENARLYGESVRHAQAAEEQSRQLGIVNRVSMEVGATLDLPQVLAAGLKDLTEALAAEQSVALVFDDGEPDRVTAGAQFPETGPRAEAPWTVAGNPVLMQLREAHSPIVAEDFDADKLAKADHFEWLGRGVKPSLLLPLWSQDVVVGVVGLGYFSRSARRRYTEEDVKLAGAIADHMAAATHNARLYGRAQKRMRELSAVNQFSRAVSHVNELKALCDIVQAQLGGILSADLACLGVYDEPRNLLSFPMTMVNGAPTEGGTRVPEGLVGYVLQTQQPLQLNGNVAKIARDLGVNSYGAWGTAISAKCFLGVPLTINGRVYGVLAVANSQRPDAIDDGHLRILSAAAPAIAASLETIAQLDHARRVARESREWAQVLETVNDAGAQVTAQSRTSEVVAAALGQLPRFISADSIRLWRRLPDGNWICEAGTSPAEAKPVAADNAVFAKLADKAIAVNVADANQTAALVGSGAVTAGMRSWLGVPLVNQDEVDGVLTLEKAESAHFTPLHEMTALAFARQLAVALSHAQVFEQQTQLNGELQTRADRLEQLKQAFAELHGSLSADDVLRVAVPHLAGAVLSSVSGVVVYPDAPGESALAYTSAPAAIEPREALPLDSSLSQHLSETLALLAVDDVAAHAVVKPEHVTWVAPDIHSALVAPLVVADALAGVAVVGRVASAGAFSLAEMDLVVALASQISAALGNARRLASAQRAQREQEAVARFGIAVGRATTYEQLLQTVRAQLQPTFGDNAVELTMVDDAPTEAAHLAVETTSEQGGGEPSRHAGHIQQIAQSRRALIFNQLEPATEANTNGDDTGTTNAGSLIGVPLVFDDKVIGVLTVADAAQPMAFDERHERMLTAFAAPLAVAVDTVRKFEQTRRFSDDLDKQLQERAAQLAEWRGKHGQVEQLARELEKRVATREAGLASLQRQYAQATDATAAAERYLAEREAELAALKEQHAQAQRGAEALERRLADVESALGEARQQHLAAQQLAQGLEQEVAEHGAELAAAREQLAQSRISAQALQTRLDKRAAEVNALHGSLEQALQVGREAETRLAALAAELASAQALHEEARDAYARLQQQGSQQAAQGTPSEQQAETAKVRELYEQARRAHAELESRFIGQSADLAAAQSRVAQLGRRIDEHAQANTQWHQQATSLAKSAEDFVSGPDLDNMLNRELLLANTALGAEYGAVLVANKSASEMLYRAVLGPVELLPTGGKDAPLGGRRGLVGAAIRERQPIIVPNLVADERWKSNPLPGSEGYLSGAVAPLITAGRTLGALLFLSKREGAFGVEQLPLITAAANQMAALLRNGELHQTFHAQARELEGMIAPQPEPISVATVTVAAVAAAATVTQVAKPPARPAAATATARPPAAAPAAVPAVATVSSRAPAPVTKPQPAASAAAGAGWLAKWHELPSAAKALALVATLVVLGGVGVALIVGAGVGAPTPATGAAASTQAVAVISPSAVMRPTVQPALPATQVPIVVSTATPKPTQTDTAAPTVPPTATFTPTFTVTPLPTLPEGVTGYAVVTLKEGTSSARLRATPGGAVIGAVPNGSQVEVLKGREIVDNINWIQVRDATGLTGWIAEELLVFQP